MSKPDGSILIVDDSETDAHLLKTAFEMAGVKRKLVIATSADQASDYLQGRPPFDDRVAYPLPALVLLDIQMPGRDGFSLLTWLREQKSMAWHRTPVIMLTTSHDFVEIRKSYDLGANSFLVKPTGFDELKKLVEIVAGYWLASNRFE